ncbi:MAG: chromosomal replication initiator protein DnaA [Cyanobacteria bacterium J06641_5]
MSQNPPPTSEISIEELWAQTLARLQQQLSRPTFETWIESIRPHELAPEVFNLRAPNSFVRNWVQKYYLPAITEVVRDLLQSPISVNVTVDRRAGELEPGDRPVQPKPIPIAARSGNIELNPRYTFSGFIVGANNRMAHAASLAVAERPGREFNPLFLCGGVGLGKTHLMQAIGQYHLEIAPGARVFYVSTEQFTNDLIAAIRYESLESFREHYRSADILLVDDIQFIEDKEYTQEEFFHTFNALHEAGKQIVLASDRPPNQIPGCSERLSSRFAMGLIADIQPPDLETRMAILAKKAESANTPLPLAAIEYIATHYPSNIRELEGALTRALTYASISGLPLTVENIARILNPPSDCTGASPEAILQAIVENFGVSIADLKGASRRREISWARQVGMYLMRQHTNLSLPRIGEVFGGKDHTTVLYGCDKVAKKQKQDPSLGPLLRRLNERISLVDAERSRAASS